MAVYVVVVSGPDTTEDGSTIGWWGDTSDSGTEYQISYGGTGYPLTPTEANSLMQEHDAMLLVELEACMNRRVATMAGITAAQHHHGRRPKQAYVRRIRHRKEIA